MKKLFLAELDTSDKKTDYNDKRERGVRPFLRIGDLEMGRQGAMVASPMKKLYLDTERIVYRLIFGEGMVILGAKAR